MHVAEHTITLGDAPVFFRTATPEAAQPSDEAPVVFVHGAPTSSDDWTAFLDRLGGIAPDLIGFGRTSKAANLDYSPEGLAEFLDGFLTELKVDQLKLVLHGWGAAAGVLLAAQDPSRVDRLVLINPLPLLEGARWPWWVRVWRRRGVGELAMGFISRMVLARGLRRGSASPDAWSPQRIGQVWEQFDQGTQRAILRLTRSIDDERVQRMAEALRSLDLPSLVVWGERDPWWGPEVAETYSSLLPRARLVRLPGAGHWPWLDDPSVVDLVASFL
ncbi:MAG TPA: alpha/beta hydrolase [Solirubrobacteraceae bacterium]|nr:alpha/beta hydrolase [Solirubrobacteraceae bacterium]